MTDDVATRLYRVLVEELRRRGHPPDQPIRVSELYEDLVPYRAVRSRIGVELNADYEDALLRLLAGEGDLLRLENDEAREELRAEAAAPYPSVSLFRKFSASRVWVERTRPVDGGTVVDHAASSEASEPVPDEAAGAPADETSVCRSCGEELPDGPARYCPRCGEDQEAGRCPSCDEPVEAEWRYCVRCGAEVAGRG